MISSVKFLLFDSQRNGSLGGKRYGMKDCAFGDGADVGMIHTLVDYSIEL